jgi:hypothetical protein
MHLMASRLQGVLEVDDDLHGVVLTIVQMAKKLEEGKADADGNANMRGRYKSLSPSQLLKVQQATRSVMEHLEIKRWAPPRGKPMYR